MTWNSTFALDRAITFCFLLLQVTRFPLKNKQYPKIPCLEYATSTPRKCFNFPNSFISNCVASFSFRFIFSISSSLVT
ncbi:hypothetical protein CR513_05794, partial [Mucuna pruriens]